MRIAANSGHTLAEILAATVVVGMIFVIVGTLYATSLRLLNSEVASRDVDSLLALETMSRNINLAEEAIVNGGGFQLQLRNDPAVDPNPATAGAADDRWVTYRFINGRLRTRAVNPPGAVPANVVDADPEVVGNVLNALVIDSTAGQSGFALVNPTAQNTATVVGIRLVVVGNPGEQNRTLTTRVALRRSK